MRCPRNLAVATLLAGLLFTAERLLFAEQGLPVYFDLGPRLTEEFRGTYEFKYKRVEFARDGGSSYLVTSSGDQSPSKARIVLERGYVYWVIDRSKEKWIALKATLAAGQRWPHRLGNWNQEYRVVATDLTISLPAGELQHCAKVEVSWAAHEHDMEGPQKEVFYLAPHLGIVKREEWENGRLWHEEVLTKYERSGAK